MRILVIFFDMLKPDLSNIFSRKKQKINNNLDNFLINFGGKSYINTYTPACETYRSLACIQTGKLPKDSGVINRMDVYEGKEALKDILKEFGYNSFAIADLEGIFSYVYNGFTDKIIPIIKERNNITSIVKLIEENSRNQNECIFLGLEIAHQIRNDVIGNVAGKIILDYVGDLLKKLFLKLDKDAFDYIIIFSDHGYRDKSINSAQIIDEERSKTFLHIRKRWQNSLEIDSNLRCTCDIFTTLKNIINSKYKIENLFGKDLLKTQGHKYIPIEDYKFWDYNGFFYRSFPNVWGIKEKDQFFITDILEDICLDNNSKKILIDKNKIQEYYEILKKETVYFKYFLSHYNISVSIKKNEKVFENYLNGKKRIGNKKKLLFCLKEFQLLEFLKNIIKICLKKLRGRNEEYNYK